MGGAPALGLLAALALTAPAYASPMGHEAPVKRLSKKKEPSAHEKLLSEMWQRRILDAESTRFSPEDMELLLRMRRAESAGALSLLQRRYKGLRGMAVIHQPAGSERSYYRLTREGFDRYIHLRTQKALRYFEKKGVDAKYVFSLKDLKGRELFDESGVLTEWGDVLYSRAARNGPAFWETPWGEVMGNRPPSQAPERAGTPASQSPAGGVKEGPEKSFE